MSEDRFCSHCGKKLDLFDLQQDFSIHTRIGYGSIYDGLVVDYQLCCDCFDREVEQCELCPVKEEVDE